MRSCRAILVLVVAVAAGRAQAQYPAYPAGQQCEGPVEYLARQYHELHIWPEPYLCPDRYATRAPFALMTQNGWRRQNILGAEHFKENGTELSETGRQRVEQIMTAVPAPHRAIFVSRSGSPEATAARIQAVAQFAATFTDGPPPEVAETVVPAPQWPADRADAVSRAYAKGMPAPMLPKKQSEPTSPTAAGGQ